MYARLTEYLESGIYVLRLVPVKKELYFKTIFQGEKRVRSNLYNIHVPELKVRITFFFSN
jgi:hypothetical protein